jgi:hypothetical protein
MLMQTVEIIERLEKQDSNLKKMYLDKFYNQALGEIQDYLTDTPMQAWWMKLQRLMTDTWPVCLLES